MSKARRAAEAFKKICAKALVTTTAAKMTDAGSSRSFPDHTLALPQRD